MRILVRGGYLGCLKAVHLTAAAHDESPHARSSVA